MTTVTTTVSDQELDEFVAAVSAFVRSVSRARGQAAVRGPGLALTLSQQTLLEALSRNGARTVGEVATAAEVAGPTATRMLDVLERRDVVRRVADPKDRRVVLVQLTDSGRRMMEERQAWTRLRQRALYEGLDVAERRAASELLTRLTELVDQLAIGPDA
jgi:DNA-binding MarR family transcriptional regulator